MGVVPWPPPPARPSPPPNLVESRHRVQTLPATYTPPPRPPLESEFGGTYSATREGIFGRIRQIESATNTPPPWLFGVWLIVMLQSSAASLVMGLLMLLWVLVVRSPNSERSLWKREDEADRALWAADSRFAHSLGIRRPHRAPKMEPPPHPSLRVKIERRDQDFREACAAARDIARTLGQVGVTTDEALEAMRALATAGRPAVLEEANHYDIASGYVGPRVTKPPTPQQKPSFPPTTGGYRATKGAGSDESEPPSGSFGA